MGGGGISLPVSMSFPISREGLAHAVKPKGVTLIGEIKDHAIPGGVSREAGSYVSNYMVGVEGRACQDITAVSDRTKYVNLTP